MVEARQWQDHYGTVIDSVDGYDVINCTLCEFKHIAPIPVPAEQQALYTHEYYSVQKPEYLNRHREDREWWDLTYGDRYDTFEKMLPPDRRKILDIGSGPGFFLLHGKERGWQTIGIEPSTKAAAHSRDLGLEIMEGFLTTETASQLGEFDVVHMSEVIEHLPDPREMVSLVRRLLTPGGIAYVTAPNDYNPFQEALRKACGYQPWWVAPPYHINYFDFDSLSQLLSSCGFEVVLRETSFPIDMFLLMGDNYVGNDALGRQLHGKRKTLEHNLALAGMSDVKLTLYRAFASSGLGRHAQVVGRAA